MPDEPSDDSWSPTDLTAMIANPFYAIQISPAVASPHETMISEEQRVEANAQLIKDLGATAYLKNLPAVLKDGP